MPFELLRRNAPITMATTACRLILSSPPLSLSPLQGEGEEGGGGDELYPLDKKNSPSVAVEGGFVVGDGLRTRRRVVVVAIPRLPSLLLLPITDVLTFLLHSHCFVSSADRFNG